MSYMDTWPSWFFHRSLLAISFTFSLGAGSFHISLISLKLYRQVSLLFIGLTWCQRIQSSDQHSVSDWCLLSECYPLNETQRLPTRWLSIPDRFRPLPRGHPQWTLPLEISRYFYRHTATFELVNTYDHLSRLCNHLWLHSPSETIWVWTRVARIWSA